MARKRNLTIPIILLMVLLVVLVKGCASIGIYRGEEGDIALWRLNDSTHTLHISGWLSWEDICLLAKQAEQKSGGSVESINMKFPLSNDEAYQASYGLYEGVLYGENDYKMPIYLPEMDVVKLHSNAAILGWEDDPLQHAKKAYELSGENKNFAVYDDCLYTKDYQTLPFCPLEKETIQFHPNLKIIGRWAFYGVHLEDTLVLPWGITTIEYLAFANCRGTVVIPDTAIYFPADFHLHPYIL